MVFVWQIFWNLQKIKTAETAKIYVYKDGGIADGKHHLVAAVLIRRTQDNTLGSFGSGAANRPVVWSCLANIGKHLVLENLKL